jgi:hypothetical protein
LLQDGKREKSSRGERETSKRISCMIERNSFLRIDVSPFTDFSAVIAGHTSSFNKKCPQIKSK